MATHPLPFSELVRKNFMPILVTTLLGSMVAGGVGGAWTILTVAFRIPTRVSAIEDDVREIKSVTDELPKTYVGVDEYRSNISEIKGDIKTILNLHLK